MTCMFLLSVSQPDDSPSQRLLEVDSDHQGRHSLVGVPKQLRVVLNPRSTGSHVAVDHWVG